MTKRLCSYTVCCNPLFRVQRAQTLLILLIDSHLMAMAAYHGLLVIHISALVQALLV